jgi:SPP1 family predicted phage head-tail adaptor
MISAGQLDKRMILQAPTIARADDGAETITWTSLATIWAGIRSLRGREYWQARQVNSDVSHEVTIRYRARISPRFRLIFEGRTFEILTIINSDEGRESLILMCKEVTA